ncbi:hypothetical protein [Flavobacterium sp. KACC 22761]|nr:hypothetical protein [Flavobacterium sp. KACC 22761]WPO76891.1 hypothetical protein SCB73_11475 [Flavobacterium sp. KACC 22761]
MIIELPLALAGGTYNEKEKGFSPKNEFWLIKPFVLTYLFPPAKEEAI